MDIVNKQDLNRLLRPDVQDDRRSRPRVLLGPQSSGAQRYAQETQPVARVQYAYSQDRLINILRIVGDIHIRGVAIK